MCLVKQARSSRATTPAAHEPAEPRAYLATVVLSDHQMISRTESPAGTLKLKDRDAPLEVILAPPEQNLGEI